MKRKQKNVVKFQPMLIRDPVVLSLIVLLVILGVFYYNSPIHLNEEATIYVEKGFQLILSCTLGSLIGLEREVKRHPAGLRTYALVCLGSTLIMVVSFGIFEEYHEMANFDPARLGAQVVSGIGFLGAGTIIHNKASVKGLTSAAGLWVVASIGLAIGAKMYMEALGYFFIVFFILHYFNNIERKSLLENKMFKFNIIALDDVFLIAQVGKAFADRKLKILSIHVEGDEDDSEDSEKIHSIEETLAMQGEDKDVNIVVHSKIPAVFDIKSIKKLLKSIDGVKYVSLKEVKDGGNYEANWT